MVAKVPPDHCLSGNISAYCGRPSARWKIADPPPHRDQSAAPHLPARDFAARILPSSRETMRWFGEIRVDRGACECGLKGRELLCHRRNATRPILAKKVDGATRQMVAAKICLAGKTVSRELRARMFAAWQLFPCSTPATRPASAGLFFPRHMGSRPRKLTRPRSPPSARCADRRGGTQLAAPSRIARSPPPPHQTRFGWFDLRPVARGRCETPGWMGFSGSRGHAAWGSANRDRFETLDPPIIFFFFFSPFFRTRRPLAPQPPVYFAVGFWLIAEENFAGHPRLNGGIFSPGGDKMVGPAPERRGGEQLTSGTGRIFS